jgi:hypothetical protein
VSTLLFAVYSSDSTDNCHRHRDNQVEPRLERAFWCELRHNSSRVQDSSTSSVSGSRNINYFNLNWRTNDKLQGHNKNKNAHTTSASLSPPFLCPLLWEAIHVLSLLHLSSSNRWKVLVHRTKWATEPERSTTSSHVCSQPTTIISSDHIQQHGTSLHPTNRRPSRRNSCNHWPFHSSH